MIYEWNAYKVFLNGKRAKRPSVTFNHADESTVSEHFESIVKLRQVLLPMYQQAAGGVLKVLLAAY